MREEFNAAQRRANEAADAALAAAGAPTYTDLRKLLDETFRVVSVARRTSPSIGSGLVERLSAAVPSYDEARRYAPKVSIPSPT